MSLHAVTDEELLALVAEGLTYEEIARRTGFAYSTIGKRLYVLRQKGLLQKRKRGGAHRPPHHRPPEKPPRPEAHADIAMIDGRPVVPMARLRAGR